MIANFISSLLPFPPHPPSIPLRLETLTSQASLANKCASVLLGATSATIIQINTTIGSESTSLDGRAACTLRETDHRPFGFMTNLARLRSSHCTRGLPQERSETSVSGVSFGGNDRLSILAAWMLNDSKPRNGAQTIPKELFTLTEGTTSMMYTPFGYLNADRTMRTMQANLKNAETENDHRTFTLTRFCTPLHGTRVVYVILGHTREYGWRRLTTAALTRSHLAGITLCQDNLAWR